MQMKRLVFILSFVVCSPCFGAPFSEKEDVAKKQLLLLAPVGSDAREAKPKLEQKGFECSWVENQYFAGLEGKHDYLYCEKTVIVGPLITRRWQLALVHESYIVKNAQFGIGLTGP